MAERTVSKNGSAGQTHEKGAALSHPFPGVRRMERTSYGGDQGQLPAKRLQKYGCGVISATDLLYYLHLYRQDCGSFLFGGERTRRQDAGNTQARPANRPVSAEPEAYNSWAGYLAARYFPVLPFLGLNGFMLVFGLNRYFRKNRIPLWAGWGVPSKKLWKRIEQMLSGDLPVILAIGPNFPFLWGRRKLALYTKDSGGACQKALETKAHYVTVTGAEDLWLEVSSWGKRYYINKEEYLEYVRRHSCFLTSNLVWLREKKRPGRRQCEK